MREAPEFESFYKPFSLVRALSNILENFCL